MFRVEMLNPQRFYTYAYLREDRTPYYIGKGQTRRLYQKDGKPCGVPKDRSRIIKLKHNLTEEEAFKHEIYMIAVYGRKDLRTGILYNRTDGGDGASGNIHSEETCKKMSKSRMRHIVSEETRQKITNSLCKASYKLYHISGKEVVVNNFTQFCRENKLHRERMMDRINGKVVKSYKGWTGHILKSLL
jgi:hypothetical protein